MHITPPFHIVAAASLALTPLLSGCGAQFKRGSVVQLASTENGYQLLCDGEPYTIYGAGGTTRLDLLAQYGGNTIRTWDAEGIAPLMDEAHALGIRVVVGIWLEHQRHGFDYGDEASRHEQLARVEQFVKEFRDHPALLAWGVGNELELGGEFDIAIKQINDASALIKRLDPNHPTMAVIAEIGDDKAVRIQRECPDIDFIGFNSYGGMGSVAKRAKQQGYTGAFAITEFGALGHWETGNSPWGAPYEQSSTEKARFIRRNYTSSVTPNLGKQCLGSFAFLWGHKQEKTETWYGLLLPTGETTESVDVLSELWTGERPDNRAPRVTKLDLGGANAAGLKPGQQVNVRVDTRDPDGDELDVQWRVIPESSVQSMGGDFEAGIQAADIMIERKGAKRALITLPHEPGAYRVFATVRDGKGHAGTINLPIMIVEGASE